MNEYDVLCGILNNRFSNISQYVMKEVKGEKTPQRVEIDKSGRKNIVWTLYRFDLDDCNFLPFFANYDGAPEGLCKFCDYVLIAEANAKTYILLIELKRGKVGGNAEKQLHASETFMTYICETAIRLHQDFDSEFFDKSNVVIRKIILKQCASPKKITKMQDIDLTQNYILYDSVGFFPITRFCK